MLHSFLLLYHFTPSGLFFFPFRGCPPSKPKISISYPTRCKCSSLDFSGSYFFSSNHEHSSGAAKCSALGAKDIRSIRASSIPSEKHSRLQLT